ncbi:beta-galactosidase 6 [Senna tora]|uniref:Beta-galactosidase n=1 Tax=Senna tora TaxID=362788 RepID=A0A835CHE2_9FABA|nr:beta-galactosidase 6 [Senna tora]
MMKSEGLYASQGGPIILSQIENEYQNIQTAFGPAASQYVNWAAKMAVGLQTGVPWVMCKQTDAPDPVDQIPPISPHCGQRIGHLLYGGLPYIRSAEDIAFHVTLFIARNGSYVNYYMYHGGTNLGRTSSAYVITAYYDQAPLDEYGLLRQPKWGHLKDLHAAIKSCSSTILQGVQKNFSLGQLQEGYTFEVEKGGCVAFLINNDRNKQVDVQFRNRSYQLLPKSISILPDCENVAFNTAKVNVGSNRRIITPTYKFSSADKWKQFEEVVPNFDDTPFKSNSLLEHMNTTKDKSDYLWYTLRYEHNLSCKEPNLHIESAAHVAHAFVNHTYIGGAHGSKDVRSFTLDLPITLNQGTNNISILSVMVGLPDTLDQTNQPSHTYQSHHRHVTSLSTVHSSPHCTPPPITVQAMAPPPVHPDSGAYLERRYAGLTNVEIQCSKEESSDLTNSTWGYQVGLVGEQLQVYKEQNGSDEIVWSPIGVTSKQTLTWYKSEFEAAKGDDPVVLDLSSMGKGEAWVNGESIGRYWILFHDSRGNPSQTLYHVPRSFLKESENVVVLMEEAGGNPLGVSLNTVSVTNLHEKHKISTSLFPSIT